MLWDLGGPGAGQVFKSWNTCIKLTWQVPRATRSYFVDQLLASDVTSVKTDIMTRYTKFLKSLNNSPSSEVSIMANIASRDVRSVTGSNIAHIFAITGLDPRHASPNDIKTVSNMLRSEPDHIDSWRIPYLAKLLTWRGEKHFVSDDKLVSEFTNLINSLCIN